MYLMKKNNYSVYQRVVSVLTQYIDIETTVLQAMSYCFYEILDNVLTALRRRHLTTV